MLLLPLLETEEHLPSIEGQRLLLLILALLLLPLLLLLLLFFLLLLLLTLVDYLLVFLDSPLS